MPKTERRQLHVYATGNGGRWIGVVSSSPDKSDRSQDIVCSIWRTRYSGEALDDARLLKQTIKFQDDDPLYHSLPPHLWTREDA